MVRDRITVDVDPHENAVRAVLVALQDTLTAATRELDDLLREPSGPYATPSAVDVSSLLRDAAGKIGAVHALRWPDRHRQGV